jgi:hypothetical protein
VRFNAFAIFVTPDFAFAIVFICRTSSFVHARRATFIALDLARRLGPDEGLGVGIVVVQVFDNGALELRDALEGAAADAISSDLGEEPLNHIEPGGRGGCEVQMEAGVRFDPALYSWGLVSGIVVYDEMEIETSGGLLICISRDSI